MPMHSAASPVLSIWRPRAGEMIAGQAGGVVEIKVWGAFLPSAASRVGQSRRTRVLSRLRVASTPLAEAAGVPLAWRLCLGMIPDVEVELPCGGGAISIGLGASSKGAVTFLPAPQGGRMEIAAMLVTRDATGASAAEVLDRVSVYLPGAGEETCRWQHHQPQQGADSDALPPGGRGAGIMARLSRPALALLLSDDPSVLSPPAQPTTKMAQLGLSWRDVAVDGSGDVGWRCAGGCRDHALCLASMSW